MEIPDAKSYIYQHTVSFILSGADDKYLWYLIEIQMPNKYKKGIVNTIILFAITWICPLMSPTPFPIKYRLIE